MFSIIVIVMIILIALSYYPRYDLQLIARTDGEFAPLANPPNTNVLITFFNQHNLKPIHLLFKTTSPFTISVRINNVQHTLTVPANYVTDGVSKPIKQMPIPHEYEDSYWVYHDYMYQHQRFDDGTPITKRQADDIMHLIICHNTTAPLWCKLYRLFVNYNNNNKHYWDSLRHRGPCFYDDNGTYSFPSCNAILTTFMH